jgi:hypothetical protein
MFGNAENAIRSDIVTRINAFGASRPRSMQKQVGCSSLGGVCDRKLGYQILGLNAPRGKSTAWLATIGTAIHTYLETVFTGSDEWVTEQPVTVKHRGIEIPGTVDLYSITHRTVIDFKLVGESTLAKARANKISRQYAVQVQLYGLGLQQAGHKVDKVGILFLPRNKELADAVLFETPFDPQVAHMALERYALIDSAVSARGIEALADLATADAPCTWCEWFNPISTELANGCPGIQLTKKTNNNNNV